MIGVAVAQLVLCKVAPPFVLFKIECWEPIDSKELSLSFLVVDLAQSRSCDVKLA